MIVQDVRDLPRISNAMFYCHRALLFRYFIIGNQGKLNFLISEFDEQE